MSSEAIDSTQKLPGNVQPPEQPDVEFDITQNDVVYQCQHCGVSYTNELFTRIHITRANDHAHESRDGFSPDTKLNVVTQTGYIIGEVSDDTITTAQTEEIQPSDFPSTLPDNHKYVALAVAYHPYETSYTKLEPIANTILVNNNEDPLSYSSIRRIIREFYHSEGLTAENASTELNTLTPLQQSLILGHLTLPDASYTTIANHIGKCSVAYVSQMLSKYNDIIETLEAKISDSSIEDVVTAELSYNSIFALVTNGYWDSFDGVPPLHAVNLELMGRQLPDAATRNSVTAERDSGTRDSQVDLQSEGSFIPQSIVLSLYQNVEFIRAMLDAQQDVDVSHQQYDLIMTQIANDLQNALRSEVTTTE